MELIFKGT